MAEIEAAGGQGLGCAMDIRFEDQVATAVPKPWSDSAGSTSWSTTRVRSFWRARCETPMKRYDLMHAVNVRGTFLTTRACLPHLLQADNPHILNIAPPLDVEPRWFAPHVAYTMAKYGMSMCVLGMAEEFRRDGSPSTRCVPHTAIATAAVANLLGGETAVRRCRSRPSWPMPPCDPPPRQPAAYRALLHRRGRAGRRRCD